MTPKKKSPAFTQLRIIGKRAQSLLIRAKEELKHQKVLSNPSPAPPTSKKCNEVMMRLSIISIVQAAFTILAIVIGTFIVIAVKDKIILILLSFFIAAIIDPGVRRMELLGFPRGIGILIQYFLFLFLFFFLLFSLIPIIASQIQQIAIFISLEIDAFLSDPQIAFPLVSENVNMRLTDFAQLTLQNISITQFIETLQQLGQNLSTAAQGSLRFATKIAGSVVNFIVKAIVVLVFAFFIQIEKEKISLWTRGFLPQRLRTYAENKSEAIHHKIAQWAQGQLLLAISIGLLVFLALVILRMPYALTLASLAAFTEFIPYIGPFIAAVPAVLIALTQEGPIWALIVVGVYYIIQWCENNLLVPLIMKRAVGLSPIAVIFAMLVGVSFPDIIHPVLGIFLAIPTTTIIALFLEDWRNMEGDKKD
jgi:predicted PurR-regulated permease PerM